MYDKRIDRTGAALVMLGLAALLAAGCTGAQGAASNDAAPEVVVRTAAVEDARVAQPVIGTGTLASKDEVPLSFKIGGVVARIDVEEGQAVRAGQRLAVLELPEIGAAVARAQAGLDKAERDLVRARALYGDSVITRELLENAETARAVAASDVRGARFNERYATIVAPGDGTVLRRLAEPGQTVSSGASIVVFGGAGRGQVVRLGLTDRDVVRLSVGDRAAVTFDAWPGRTWAGRVARIGAAAAPGMGTWDVEVRLDAPVRVASGAGLASGLIGNVTLSPSRTQAVRFIPVEALLEGDGERAMVWSLTAAGGTERRSVRVAWIDGDRVAVSGGLEGVDRVVAAGAAYLTSATRALVEVR